MKVIIIGAGELGRNLASTFCNDKHDVVLVDHNITLLERVRSKYDVMTLAGNGAAFDVLKQAQPETADMLIAVSNDDTANIMACQIARHFGIKNTICRTAENDYFSVADGFTPEKLGINLVVIPQEECAQKILNILDNPAVLEKISFSVADALMTAFRVMPSSPIAGMRIKDFPDVELLKSVRFSAIVRKHQLITPYGDTIIVPGDEIYVAGRVEAVNSMVEWANPDQPPPSRIIIVGASTVGKVLASRLCALNYDVRLIEGNQKVGEDFLDESNQRFFVINGNPNEGDVLEEAGISTCDIFISALHDDEDNILSCILAKEMGASKVVAITNKPEYMSIVQAMDMIDCCFSVRLVAANSILRYIGTGEVHTDAVLHRANASVSEFEVRKDSPVCNMKIEDCKCPTTVVFSFVFRDGEVLAPAGDLKLMSGDMVAAITTGDTVKEVSRLFHKKGLFSV